LGEVDRGSIDPQFTDMKPEALVRYVEYSSELPRRVKNDTVYGDLFQRLCDDM